MNVVEPVSKSAVEMRIHIRFLRMFVQAGSRMDEFIEFLPIKLRTELSTDVSVIRVVSPDAGVGSLRG
jgi:hypothetical protein